MTEDFYEFPDIENNRMKWVLALIDCPYSESTVPLKDKLSGVKSVTLREIEQYLGYKFGNGHVRRFLRQLIACNVLVEKDRRKGIPLYIVDTDLLHEYLLNTSTFTDIKKIIFWGHGY